MSGAGARASNTLPRRHWDSVYRTRAEDELSWHQDEPKLSLRWVEALAAKSDRIIDVGGGSSLLASRLGAAGYRRLLVLDVAPHAIERSKARSPSGGKGIRFRVGDVTSLPSLGRFDLWHDRAVFHFLTDSRDRHHYVDLAARTVPVGGHLILATFSNDGPVRCSGLPVARYDATALAHVFRPRFQLSKSTTESHRTPWGTVQEFTYVVLSRVRGGRASPDRDPPAGR
ncbi:MAG: class I SAM-dependent methyltransferase [Thermoplasmata archaeon]|nr:class I SAM-dependent methyltransferase [Thermoplasmata archaeon]